MLDSFIATYSNANTAGAYRRNVARFIEWLGADRLADLTAGELENFLVYLQEEGYADKSVNQQLSAVKSFLKWAARQRLVPASVYHEALTVEQLKEAKRLPKPLRDAEVAALLEQPDLTTLAGARDYAFIKLALASGARLSELVNLDIEALDWDRREVVVFGKGAKERVILFDEEAASALVYYLGLRGSPRSGPLFTNEEGERISARWFQKEVRRYGERAGVQGLHPHRFRHTFAVRFLNRSRGNLEVLSTLLGHEDPRTTRIYAALATDVLRGVYDEAFASPVPLEKEPASVYAR